jgi:hypothetical protein
MKFLKKHIFVITNLIILFLLFLIPNNICKEVNVFKCSKCVESKLSKKTTIDFIAIIPPISFGSEIIDAETADKEHNWKPGSLNISGFSLINNTLRTLLFAIAIFLILFKLFLHKLFKKFNSVIFYLYKQQKLFKTLKYIFVISVICIAMFLFFSFSKKISKLNQPNVADIKIDDMVKNNDVISKIIDTISENLQKSLDQYIKE